jgi:hypothetical protein
MRRRLRGSSFAAGAALVSTITVVLHLFGSPSVPEAKAWEPREVRPSATTNETEKKRPKVTLYWFMKSSYRAKTGELVRQIEENLRHDQKISFRPAREILEPGTQAEEAFGRAEKLVKEAKDLAFNLELEKAKSKAKEAVRLYEDNFHGFLEGPFGTQPLEKALAALAAIAFQSGQADLTRKALMKLMALKPKLKHDPKKFPAGMKETILNLQLEMDEMGTAAIQISTKPKAARVFLNGKKLGRSPLNAPKVKMGYHYVSLRRDGYKSTTKVVKVEPPTGPVLSVRMDKVSPKLFGHLREALDNLGAARAGSGAVGAGNVLGVQILILGRIVMRGNEAKVTLFPYDLRSRRLLKGPVTATMDVGDLGDKPASLAKRVLSDVPLDGSIPKVKKKKKKKKSVFWKGVKQKWRSFREWEGFWYTVGGVAGVIVLGTAIGLAVGLSPRNEITRIPGGTRTVILGQRGKVGRAGVRISSF